MTYWLLKTIKKSRTWLTEQHTLQADTTNAKRFSSEDEAQKYAIKIHSETFLKATKYT